MKVLLLKLVLFAAVTAAVLFCTANPGTFICTRDGILDGEYWRMFTGHFVHFTRSHMITNLASLGILLVLMQRARGWHLFWLGLVTPIALGAALYLTRPELAAYGGLSGWIAALFVMVSADRALNRTWTGHFFRVGLVLFIAKLVVEFSLGRSVVAHLDNGVLVEPAAHAIGAGIAVLGLFLDPGRWAARRQPAGSDCKAELARA